MDIHRARIDANQGKVMAKMDDRIDVNQEKLEAKIDSHHKKLMVIMKVSQEKTEATDLEVWGPPTVQQALSNRRSNT
jgi:hypothetical protein